MREKPRRCSRVETDSVPDRPISPDSHVLPESPVTRTRHIGEDAVEQHGFILLVEIGFREFRHLALVVVGEFERLRGRLGQPERGKLSRVMVRDHHSGSGHSVERLVHEEVAPFRVRVVRNEETLRDLARAVLAIGRRAVEVFEDLDTLTAWRCAHVESRVTRLDVEQERRDHRDGLLPRDVARVRLVHEEVLELLERVNLSKG